MKRIISALLLILVITSSCASRLSCGNTPYVEGEGELSIVATCFPAFDFAREIAGEKATIQLLQYNGDDMHDYTPTTATLTALKDADIFICVGGNSDKTWIDDVIENCKNPDLVVIKLIDYVNISTVSLNGHTNSAYCSENHNTSTLGSFGSILQGTVNGNKDYTGVLGDENSSSANDSDTSDGDNSYDGNYKTEVESGEVKDGYIDENGNFVEIDPGESSTGDKYFVISGANGNNGQYIVNGDSGNIIINGSNGEVKYEYVTGTGNVGGIFESFGAMSTSSIDEHVWTSPKAVIKMADAIAEACSNADTENKVFYKQRLNSFKSALEELDTELTQAISQSTHKTLVFADQFPFVYMTKEYGLCYYSAYAGCSSEAFAGFETVAKLVETVKTLSLPAIITLENPDDELARTIADLVDGQQIDVITLNSLQTVTKDQIVNGGLTYLKVMKQNIDALKEALK